MESDLYWMSLIMKSIFSILNQYFSQLMLNIELTLNKIWIQIVLIFLLLESCWNLTVFGGCCRNQDLIGTV